MLDSSLGLKAGDVFQWENYPLFEHEPKNRRWFLFLGNQSLEGIVYEITTTTQYQHYEKTGKRHGHNYFTIQAGIAGLIVDSVVDITQYFDQLPEAVMNSDKENIKKTGTLPQDVVHTLVRHIKESKNIPQIVKRDIYGYLKEAGFAVHA